MLAGTLDLHLPGERLAQTRRQPWPVVKSTTPSLAFFDTTQTNQAGQPASKQANPVSQSVSQNRLQIWPLQVSQPPPTSRGTVAVGADPGSEISITLGTDCTATTVPYHTGSREILPFRTRAAVCHLSAARTLPPCKHASSTRQVSGPPSRPGHTLTGQDGQAGRGEPPGHGHGHDHGNGHAARTASFRWPGMELRDSWACGMAASVPLCMPTLAPFPRDGLCCASPQKNE